MLTVTASPPVANAGSISTPYHRQDSSSLNLLRDCRLYEPPSPVQQVLIPSFVTHWVPLSTLLITGFAGKGSGHPSPTGGLETNNRDINKRPKAFPLRKTLGGTGFYTGYARLGIATVTTTTTSTTTTTTTRDARHGGLRRIRRVRRLPRERGISQAVRAVEMDAANAHAAVGRDDAGEAEGADAAGKV